MGLLDVRRHDDEAASSFNRREFLAATAAGVAVEHWRNLLDCCRTRQKATWSPMDLAFRTQTVLHMASLAMRAGQTARFDAAKREIVI